MYCQTHSAQNIMHYLKLSIAFRDANSQTPIFILEMDQNLSNYTHTQALIQKRLSLFLFLNTWF